MGSVRLNIFLVGFLFAVVDVVFDAYLVRFDSDFDGVVHDSLYGHHYLHLQRFCNSNGCYLRDRTELEERRGIWG